MTRREELINQYKMLHERSVYGVSGDQWWTSIAFHELAMIRPRIDTLLDFGCGQAGLGRKIAEMWEGRTGGELLAVEYDPAIPGIDKWPCNTECMADAVVCCDVMEHIPEEDIHSTLAGIHDYSGTDKVFFAISTVPAVQILPNGENAHCTVKPFDWWEEEITLVFGKCRHIQITNAHFVCATW